MNSESLDSALLALQAIVQNESGLSVQELDAALARVAAFGSPRTAAPLLKLLDDQAQQDERMFSLIHAAEAFDDDAYVPELLTVLPSLRERSPKWASIVLLRALNNEHTRVALVHAVRNAASPIREAVQWLCERINERGAQFLSKTLPVLLAVRDAREGEPMRVRRWGEISDLPLSEQVLREMFVRADGYWLYPNRYEAGVGFPGTLAQPVRLYVFEGECSYSFGKATVRVRGGEIVDMLPGAYDFEVTADGPVRLMKVFRMPESPARVWKETLARIATAGKVLAEWRLLSGVTFQMYVPPPASAASESIHPDSDVRFHEIETLRIMQSVKLGGLAATNDLDAVRRALGHDPRLDVADTGGELTVRLAAPGSAG